MKLQSSCQQGWQSSEGLTGLAGPLPTGFIYIAVGRRSQFLTACWQKSSVPFYAGLSTRLAECPRDMAVGFCQSK